MQGSAVRCFALALLLATISATAAPPAGYYDSASGLTGNDLRDALHDIIDDHTIISYGSSRAPMAALHEDPNNSSNLIQIYTQDSVPKSATNLWNREHLWPRSRGNSDQNGPDDSDLHHLFPSDYGVNSDRGSLIYDRTSPANSGVSWSRDGDSFQPPANVVGDIARALFYVAVRYDGSDGATTDMELVFDNVNGSKMGLLDVLLEWNAEDPPDAFERRRNDLIFSDYQGNRNPFVDNPAYATAIWGGTPISSQPSLTVESSDASEIGPQAGTITFRSNLVAPVDGIVVAFQLGGTATASDFALAGTGLNYDSSNGIGSILLFESLQEISLTLTPLADDLIEGTENVSITIFDTADYELGEPSQTSLTILDEASPSGGGEDLEIRWDFEGALADQIPSDIGNGTLDLSGWNGTLEDFGGSSGKSLSLVGASPSGGSVDFKFSSLGYEDLSVTFQTRSSNTGHTSGTWAWSIDGANFTMIDGLNTAANGGFSERNFSLAPVPQLENSNSVTLRYTLTRDEPSSGNTRLDEFVISGTALPQYPALYSQAWLAAQDLAFTIEQSSLDADPDGDGYANLLEYALDAAAIGFTPQPIQFVGSEIQVVGVDDSSLHWSLEASVDLESWGTAEVLTLETQDASEPGKNLYRWQLANFMEDVDRVFFRLSVSVK